MARWLLCGGVAASLLGLTHLGNAQPVAPILGSGQVASNGYGIARFGEVAAAQRGDVAVIGTGSAVLRRLDDGTLSIVLATGMRPTTLPGSVNDLLETAANDGGSVAVHATVNTPAGREAILLADEVTGQVRTLQIADTLSAPDLSNGRRVTWHDGETLHLWTPEGGRTTVAHVGDAAPGGGTFAGFGRRPVVSDSGHVAFQAALAPAGSGIFVWAPAIGLAAAAREGEIAPGTGLHYGPFAAEHALAIRPHGTIQPEVAFAAPLSVAPFGPPDFSALFRALPGAGTTAIAHIGDQYEAGRRITGFVTRFVGVGPDGRIVFEATTEDPDGHDWVVEARLEPGGVVIAGLRPSSPHWRNLAPRYSALHEYVFEKLMNGSVHVLERDGSRGNTILLNALMPTPYGRLTGYGLPSISPSGLVVTFMVERSALYRWRTASGLIQVVGPGNGTWGPKRVVMDASGYLVTYQSTVPGGRVVAQTPQGGQGALLAIARNGDEIEGPVPGIIDLDDARAPGGIGVRDGIAYAVARVSGTQVVFRKAVDEDAELEIAAMAGDPAPPGEGFLESIWGVYPGTRELLLAASTWTSTSGLYLRPPDGGPAKHVVAVGDPSPRSGSPYTAIGALAYDGDRRVLFAATMENGRTGVHLWKAGALVALVEDGDHVPGIAGSTIGVLDIAATACGIAPGYETFVVPLEGTGPTHVLLRRTGGPIGLRLVPGTLIPGGGRILGFADRGLVQTSPTSELAVDLDDAPTWAAVVAVQN